MEKFFPKVTHLGKVTLIDAPLSYNIRNGSKESGKYNQFHHHLADKIRELREQNSQFVLVHIWLVI